MAHLKRNIQHAILVINRCVNASPRSMVTAVEKHNCQEGSKECFTQDIKRCRYDPEKPPSLSCGQSKKSMMKSHGQYSLISSKLGDKQDSLDLQRKRPLPVLDKDGICECYPHIQTHAKTYDCIAFSQNDLEKSMQNFPCRPKRNKPTTEEGALSTDIQFNQSTRHILGEIWTDEAIHCSKQRLSEKACCINTNNGFVEAKVQPSNVDTVIDMLRSKMESIYDCDLSAIQAQESKLDSLANDAKHSNEIDAKVEHFISKCAPISSSFDEDPILALSYRMRSILLQSPYLVP